ncbi:XRE family transcriptional regulator, partial [Staphylococcus aureus]
MRTNDEIITIIKTSMKEQNMSLSELARRVGVAK